MKYLQTNALTLGALLGVIRDFLDNNGWSVRAQAIGDALPSLEMTNSIGHHFKFSTVTQNTGIWIPGASNNGYQSFVETILRMTFDRANIGGAPGYSINYSEVNDVVGPHLNVWLVTDDAATYCHVVMQTSNSRYHHFSFGNLDNRGLHALPLPYCMGLRLVYWRTNEDYSNVSADAAPINDISATGAHYVGFFGENSDATENIDGGRRITRVGLPDGLLDPLLGFTDGIIESPLIKPNSNRRHVQTPSGDWWGTFLDHLRFYDNQGYTGGVPIFPAPIVVRNPAHNAHCYVGEYPGIGQVNMDGLAPQQVLNFAGEEWMCFPLMQMGQYEAANPGINPQLVPNSLNYGIAIRRA